MLKKLIEIVKRLRAPDGCPWDKEQTVQSLTPHIIEEAYELVDAIESNDTTHFKEELGDVLLHVVMLSSMAEEKAWFTLPDVIDDVTEKMIRRHPHVFGDKEAKTVQDVWETWESVKMTEKKTDSIMDAIPKLPSLLQAHKIQKKAARVGFDWPDSKGPLEKLTEELQEFKEALNKNMGKAALEDEAGDILFTIVNILRKYDINPEEALRRSNKKFIHRFKIMEADLEEEDFKEMPLSEKEKRWQNAKQK